MSNPNGNIPDYLDENCTMCRFYCATQRVCCRYPPPVNVTMPSSTAAQPTVSKFDWCGEFTLAGKGQ